MKKNITALLQKGNLTPKERIILLLQNDIITATTGKEPLTEADKKALQNWQAKTNQQAQEWNKYSEGWKLWAKGGLEAEIVYLDARVEHFRESAINTHLHFYPYCRRARGLIAGLEKIKEVNFKEAIEIKNKQREAKLKEGLDINKAIYQLAFESLSEDLRKDILTLYPDAATEIDYLDEEEIIADLLNGQDWLTKEAKEKLAELIAAKSYNAFAKEYQLFHYFASIQLLKVAGRWAKEKGLKPTKIYSKAEELLIKKVAEEQKISEGEAKETLFLENELKDILENYARDNKTTIEAILKETLIKWLEEGLPYLPLVISDNKATFSGIDTKLPHKEVFKEWLKAKEQAKATLQALIDKGELKVSEKIITGESLYNFKGDYKFIKDFKEWTDEYNANLGIVYAADDPEHKGDNLDQELLVCNKYNIGRPTFFSNVSLIAKELKTFFENLGFIKEIEKDGETILDFDNDKLKKAYKEIRENLINGYSKLLAFKEAFKKLSKTYEVDLTFLTSSRLEEVGDFIDQHNDALREALGKKRYIDGKDEIDIDDIESLNLFSKRELLKLEDDLFIDKDKILPDIDTKESWGKKFISILGDDF